MYRFGFKRTQPLTLDENLASAAATHEATVGVFRSLLDDFRTAEAKAKGVSELANSEASRLVSLTKAADAQAKQSATVASNLASLIGE